MSGEEAAENLLFDGFELNRRGLFRLDPTGKALPVALGSRALDLLLLLAKHGGMVVSKHDLMAGVWPGLAVEESNLTKQISALRRELDRNPGLGSCIQTVPGRGYRFVATMTRTDRTTARTTLAAPEKPSIVVLPFQNLSSDPEQYYFAEGLVEEITTAIARFPWLFVLARRSRFAYKGKAVDAWKAARELGVRYVLQGSVRKDSNRVRISAALIDATTTHHIWGDRFDGTLGDIFALQDRIAAAVVCAIEPRLRLAELERVIRKPAESLDVYDLDLRALAHMSQRTKESFGKASQLLHRALKLDPAYGSAMGRLGYLRLMQAARHWVPRSGSEVAEGIAIARRAIAEARDDPEVLTAAGQTLAFFTGETETALGAFDRAIDLNPNYGHAFGQQAMVLAWLNRPEDAIAAAQKAINLSPHDPDMFVCWLALTMANLAAARWEEALLWADYALLENAGAPALRLKLSLCGHLGRHEEAHACLRRLREVHAEPTVAAIKGDLGKGMSADVVACLTEGLHKASLPAK